MQPRTFSCALTLALLVAPLFESEARASTFDANAGALSLDKAASLGASLDSAAGLAGLPSRVFAIEGRQGGYTSLAASTEVVDAKSFAKDAIEGGGALRVAGNRAVL